MKKVYTFFVTLFFVFIASPVMAGDDLAELKSMVQKLMKQNQELAAKVKELEKRLASYERETTMEQVPPEESQQEEHDFNMIGYIRMGVVADSNRKASDFGLAEASVTISGRVNEWVGGNIRFEEENPPFEDTQDVFVEDAFIILGNTEKFPVYGKIGVFYVPYGALLTHFPNDPLVDIPVTLTFGEIEEHALLLGFEKQGFAGSFYVFNGDVEEESDSSNHIEDFGLDLNYTYENEEQGLSIFVGGSYISNVADTNGLSEIFGDRVKDKEGGVALYSEITFRNFFVLGEYMSALDDIVPAGKTAGYKPSVWNIEAGFNYEGLIKPVEVAFKYAGGNDDAQELDFPESRYGVAVNVDLFESVGFGAGYFHDELKDDDKRDVFFGQVDIEFGL
ncbi:LbtU family siderophore porin [Thermodesulfatator atlanticus]